MYNVSFSWYCISAAGTMTVGFQMARLCRAQAKHQIWLDASTPLTVICLSVGIIIPKTSRI